MVSLVASKSMLACTNFFLLVCGCTLVCGGLMILLDPARILLSRLLSLGPLSALPYPLFHYLSIGLAALGLTLAGAGVLGCWASCLHSYCMLTFYFLLIMVVLVGECAVYTVAWIWPQCLGLGIVRSELIALLQASYGVAGHEQITAAIDLAQTAFNCCGISSSLEYDTSIWKTESLGPGLAVPLTCCILEETTASYLDPHPVNLTLCQAIEVKTQQGYRHIDGCIKHLEDWFKEQYLIFLVIGLVIVLVEFTVLLSTIFACTRLYRYKQIVKTTNRNMELTSNVLKDDSIYQSTRRIPFGYSNDAYTLTKSFRQNYKIVDKA